MAALLQSEWQQLHDAFHRLLSAWDLLLHGIPAGERTRVILQSGLPLVLLFPARWLAKHFAHLLTGALAGLHNRLISGSIRHQGLRALARFISAITPLLPWLLLLWLSLYLPQPAEDDSGHELAGIGGALPLLLQVYFLYVLVKLASEWFLMSVCQGAGLYLNGEGTARLEQRTRAFTSWLLLPWVLIALADYLFHHSVISQLVGAFVWLFSWVVISYLLQFYREELVLNLKRLLPETLDPVVEKAGSGRLMILTLPLWVPFNLVLFLKAFIADLLSEFTWYQKLNARWFRMKNQVADNDDEDNGECTDDNYLRWFTANGDWEYPIIDTGLSSAVRKHFDTWNSERSDENVLLITGEPGIGKKSAAKRFANAISNDLQLQQSEQRVDVRLLDVPAKTTGADDLHRLLGNALGLDLTNGPLALAEQDEALPPTVIILNDAENLFLADVGCLDGWRALLALTNARVQNLYWLIVINNQSWAYLCNVFGRDYQMRNVVRVKRWTQAEIRSLILSRNQQSGYRLQYDDVLIDTRTHASATVRNAEQRYFSLLWDACHGIPVTALMLWKESVTTHRGVVTVSIPRLPTGARLEKSGPKMMFVFAAIVTHGNLTTGELMRVTNMPENVIRFIVKTALEGDMMEKGADGRYRITALWYHTVVSTLNRMNMLNE
ncbi:ATP-binding protein [Thalassolituus sp. LLYu03]|uniref:ATP-binding protein n=1 Tax=Thalassolituus sp. LLYu03 TaxID=3421656 RepID=UPI003D29F7B5